MNSRQRTTLQSRIENLLSSLNSTHRGVILAQFVITAGDEFQGLLASAEPLPDIIWRIEIGLADVEVRVGVGLGTLTTPLRERAIGMDGPAWHQARDAIIFAKSKRRLGGIFRGFPEPEETVANGFAAVLRHIRSQLTRRQLMLMDVLRTAKSQKDIAKAWRVSKQAINKQAAAAGWEAYREGEHAWRTALARFEFSRQWAETSL